MIELGKYQILKVVRKSTIGVYLGDEREQVLLPKKQVPQDISVGDSIKVFIYRDSEDRLISTVNQPLLTLGEVAMLTVKDVSKNGAYLDWGLEKDLLLPFREQTMRVKEGQECLVALYIDKSERLCATMKVYPYLSLRTPYGMNDEVQGRVYEISERFGVFVAVDDHYCAMVPKREAQGKFRIGEVRKFRVTEVKEDGKMNLSAHQKAYLQIGEDAKLVRKVIDEFAGVLPFDDKVSPQVIEREFGLSKNAFKRAVGHMLKNGEIEIRDGRIYRRD